MLNDALLAAPGRNVDCCAGLLRHQLQYIGQSRVFRIDRKLAVSINDHRRMFDDCTRFPLRSRYPQPATGTRSRRLECGFQLLLTELKSPHDGQGWLLDFACDLRLFSHRSGGNSLGHWNLDANGRGQFPHDWGRCHHT